MVFGHLQRDLDGLDVKSHLEGKADALEQATDACERVRTIPTKSLFLVQELLEGGEDTQRPIAESRPRR